MATKKIDISGGFYVSDSLPISSQEAINCYPVTPETQTVTGAYISGTPGRVQLLSLSDVNSCRGSKVMNGIPYFVIGSILYRINRSIDADGVETFTGSPLGTVAGSGTVSMDTNGLQLVIVVPGAEAYCYVPADVTPFNEITDTNAPLPANQVTYIDGYMVFVQEQGKIAFHSPLNDYRGDTNGGTAYNALDFMTAEADPDEIKASINFKNQLFLIGSETTQVFQNVGRIPAAFDPIVGFVIPKGIDAVRSLVVGQNTFAMIGGGPRENPAVWAYTGNNFQKISTRAIDNVLQGLTDTELDTITTFSYAYFGQYFIGFVLPDTCFVYNFTNQRWHERRSYNDGEVTYRSNFFLSAYGRIMCGDRIDGRIGEVNEEIHLEYDELMRRTFTSRPFDNNGDPVRMSSIEAWMQSGMGNDYVRDPQIRLSWSDDGSRTWSNELSRSIGKIGEYKRRTIWRKLGRFPRSRTLRIEYSENTKFTLIALELSYADSYPSS